MNKPQRGLGKGLGAILGEVPGANELRKPVGYVNKEIVGAQPRQSGSDVMRIPVEMIERNPYQPRETFEPEALEELASSIKTLGLIQPITVRKVAENRFQIISGERRFRACSSIGMKMVPAYVRTTNDQGMLEMAIVENVQRENLDPIEEAISYRRLMEECNLTQEEMAARLGKKRASVSNYLRLLALPDKAQHDLKVGLLSVGHAKVILGVDDPLLQERLGDKVIAEGLSVRALEEVVRKILASGEASPKQKRAEIPASGAYSEAAERICRFLPQESVSVKCNASGKGTITLKFSDEQEVLNFLEAAGLK